MLQLLATTGVRLLACAAVAFLLWQALGAAGLAVSAPLFGLALAKPIYQLVADLRQSAKALAYSDDEGNYYEHRGYSLKVMEDEEHHRWLSVRDVRKLVAALPSEAVLQRSFPERVRHERAFHGQALRADALLSYLEKSTSSESIKLRIWLQRDVIRPAQTARRRLGIEDKEAQGAETRQKVREPR